MQYAIQAVRTTTVPPVDSHYRTEFLETDGTTWFVVVFVIVRFLANLTLWIFIIIILVGVRFVATVTLWIHIDIGSRFTTTLWG